MIARREIGLLIIQIGLNQTPFLSEQAFLIATWASILSTIIGPVVVWLLLKRNGRTVSASVIWEVQKIDDLEGWTSDDKDDERAGRWASRRHSRSVSRAEPKVWIWAGEKRKPVAAWTRIHRYGIPRSPLPPGIDSLHKTSLPDLGTINRDLSGSDEKIAGDLTPMQQRWASKRVITYQDSTPVRRTRNSIAKERPIIWREAVIEEVPTLAVESDGEKGSDDAGLKQDGGDRKYSGRDGNTERKPGS